MAQKEKMCMKKLAKRVLWTLTALCMLFASATAVWGEGGGSTMDGSKTEVVTVKGSLVKGTPVVGNTISVEISWGAMEFTYTEGQQVWNTQTHQYEYPDAKWTGNGNTISVSNHSDKNINVGFCFAQIGEINELDHTFYKIAENNEKAELSYDSENYRSYLGLIAGTYDAEKQEAITDSANVELEITGGQLPERYNGNPSQIGTITISLF